MAWLDGTYVQSAIGSPQGYALGLLTTPSGVVTTDRFDQYERTGRSRVTAVLQHAGYAAPGATLTGSADNITDAFLRDSAAAVMFKAVYAMVPGIALPQQSIDNINETLGVLDAVLNKKIPPPGMEPDPLDGIDGSQFNTDPSYQPESGSPVFTSLRRSSF